VRHARRGDDVSESTASTVAANPTAPMAAPRTQESRFRIVALTKDGRVCVHKGSRPPAEGRRRVRLA
jgi:hypothetical protein